MSSASLLTPLAISGSALPVLAPDWKQDNGLPASKRAGMRPLTKPNIGRVSRSRLPDPSSSDGCFKTRSKPKSSRMPWYFARTARNTSRSSSVWSASGPGHFSTPSGWHSRKWKPSPDTPCTRLGGRCPARQTEGFASPPRTAQKARESWHLAPSSAAEAATAAALFPAKHRSPRLCNICYQP